MNNIQILKQFNDNTTLEQLKTLAQKSTGGLKVALEEISRKRKSNPNTAIGDIFKENVDILKKHLVPVKKQGAQFVKNTVGINSYPEIMALKTALDELYTKMNTNNKTETEKYNDYNDAIFFLEKIEKEYPIYNKDCYDKTLVNYCNEMRNNIVEILSREQQNLEVDTVDKVKEYRKKIFEEKKASFISLLKSARDGGQDQRKKLKQIVEKIDFDPQHSIERVKRFRRHIVWDSRSSMDYLISLMTRIEFNEDVDAKNVAKNHYFLLSLQLINVGTKIAYSTANNSLLQGMINAANMLLEQTKEMSVHEAINKPLSQFVAQLESRLKEVEALSYDSILKNSKGIKQKMKNLFVGAQIKGQQEKELIEPYIPPQMPLAERKKIILDIMQKKLGELVQLAKQQELGLNIAQAKGTAATTVSGITASATEGAVSGVAGLVKSLLPSALGVNTFVEGQLKSLGKNLVTEKATEKVETTLDQTADKDLSTLLTFLAKLTEEEQLSVAQSFAKLLAATFPHAMDVLIINQYDEKSATQIATKIVETALYTLSAFTKELNHLKESQPTCDPDKVADLMIDALIQANQNRVKKNLLKTHRPPVIQKHEDGTYEIHNPHVEDLFGGKCGLVVNDKCHYRFFAPEGSDPSRFGFMVRSKVKAGYSAYQYNDTDPDPSKHYWGEYASSKVDLDMTKQVQFYRDAEAKLYAENLKSRGRSTRTVEKRPLVTTQGIITTTTSSKTSSCVMADDTSNQTVTMPLEQFKLMQKQITDMQQQLKAMQAKLLRAYPSASVNSPQVGSPSPNLFRSQHRTEHRADVKTTQNDNKAKNSLFRTNNQNST